MLDDVKYLVDMGFAVHLLHKKAKNPAEKRWSEAKVFTFDELSEAYQPGQNVGVRLGKPSRIGDLYLHAIDLDIRDPDLADEAIDALREMFGKRGLKRMWSVRSGSGGHSRHYYFLCEVDFPTSCLARSEAMIEIDGRMRRSWEIDLMGTGKQAVLPPSIHPDTGLPYEWLIDPDLDFAVEVDADYLTDLLEPEEYEADRDTDPLGLSFDEAREYLERVAHWADDHENWRNVGMALKHEFGDAGWELFDEWSSKGHGYNRRDNKYQWNKFTTDRRDVVTMRTVAAEARKDEIDELVDMMDDADIVREEVETAKEAVEKIKERVKGDPDMTLLLGGKKAAPRLPLAILGKILSTIVKEQAKANATSEDFIVAGLLSAASGVLGNAIRVQIRTGFEQTPILWCQMVGDPSTNKTPAASVVTSALNVLEARYEPFYREAMKNWRNEAEKAEHRYKAWQARKKAQEAEGTDFDEERPENTFAPPEPPKRPFIHNDMTVEAFVLEQSRSPRGFMMFRDELAGWLGSMERYSSETDRALWLESFNGGTYKVSRVKYGDDPIKVARLCSPVLGGIQPERLLQITAESEADDGLIARLLPFWPDMAYREMSPDHVDNAPIVEIFQRLSEVTMVEDKQGNPAPQVVPFTAAAFDIYRKWSNARKKSEQFAPRKLRGVFGKAEGQVARIAAVLEFLRWAAEDRFSEADAPSTISVESVKNAIKFRTDYIRPMQERVFSQAVEPDEMINARVLADWIISEDIHETTVRLIRREGGLKGMRQTSERTKEEIIDAAIAVLVSKRWLTVDEAKSAKGGRPSKRYIVNERVWQLAT